MLYIPPKHVIQKKLLAAAYLWIIIIVSILELKKALRSLQGLNQWFSKLRCQGG